MKKLVLLALFINTLGFAQEREFTFTKDGFTDFVITEVPNKNQSELYKKALDWVAVTYNNPKEVIKAQIENDYIRIEGIKSSAICTKILLTTECDDTKYQIEISFKDGKYKFDVISIEQYIKPSKYSSIYGWRDTVIASPGGASAFYREDGEIRSMYKYYPTQIPKIFNDLNSSLKDFLNSNSIPSKKSDW
jgi:hypothetical protein